MGNLSRYPTKIKMLFGQNLFDLVPESDPAQAWFRQRISLPDYDVMTIVPPTQTFADHFTFHLPNDTLHLEYWGPAHCDGDVIVWLPKSRVVFLGDLLFYGRFPWLGDCDLSGLIDRLARVLTLDASIVIQDTARRPISHRSVPSATCWSDAACFARPSTPRACPAAREEAAVREVKLPHYADIPRYVDWLPHDVRAAYRYLRA